jgi:recombination protein RecA
MSDAHMGLQARLMSKAMRKLAGVMNRSDCTAIFINQLREKIGVMFGNPETTTGGKALKFYASIRVDVRKSEAIKSGTDIIGNKVNVKIVKNKVAPPFKVATVDIMYGKGISRIGELIELAVDRDIIQKAGAWFSYNGEKIGQGKEAARAFLQANPVICNTIEVELKQKLFAKVVEEGEEGR